jgi:hypothetical protein
MTFPRYPRIHYVMKDGRVRCGKKQLGMIQTYEPEINCRMCLRCIDLDNGLRYTR